LQQVVARQRAVADRAAAAYVKLQGVPAEGIGSASVGDPLRVVVVRPERLARAVEAQVAAEALAREIEVVDLVDHRAERDRTQRNAIGRWRELHGSRCRGAHRWSRAQAEADLAVLGEVGADVDAEAARAQVVARNALRAVEEIHRVALDDRARRHEQVASREQRLVELGGEEAVLADLQVGAPFAAERVDPRSPIARARL
jgi:hypothetical protein